MNRTLLMISLVGLGFFSAQIQKRASAQQEHPFVEGELTQKITKPISLRYLLYLPEDYASTSKRWPLLLYLHGGLGRGNDFQKLYWYPIPKMILEHQFPDSLVAVIPQCPDGKTWSELTDELSELVTEITDRYPIDTSRIYGMGYSMGGNGIVYLAFTHPEMFAALAPMSGYYHTWWVARMKELPIWFFHGALDTLVSVAESDKMVAAYQKLGVQVKYSRAAEGIHRPLTVEQHLELLQWFFKQSK